MVFFFYFFFVFAVSYKNILKYGEITKQFYVISHNVINILRYHKNTNMDNIV